MKNGKETGKKRNFWKIYGIVFGVLGVLLIAFLIWFRFWLKDYEKSERLHVAERAVAMFTEEQYGEITAMTDIVRAGLQPADPYLQQIRTSCAGKEISYAKAFSYDRFEKPIYAIQADGETLCKVVLKKSGKKTTFGFALYEIDYFTDFAFAEQELSFYLPSYYIPYINDTRLDETFILQDGLEPQLLAYAVTDRQNPCMRKYQVNGMLQPVSSVRVFDAEGREAEVTEKDGTYEAHFRQLTFQVPADLTVTVNGITLGERNRVKAVQSGIRILTENPAAADAREVTYRADYLTQNPEILLKDAAGEAVDYTYNRAAGTVTAGYTVFTVSAPSGSRVTANGIVISDSDDWVAERNQKIEGLSSIPDEFFPDGRPTLTLYRFAVKADTAEVTAVNLRGETVPADFDEETMTFTCGFTIAEGAETYTRLAMERSQMYSKFIARDLSMSEFLAQILPGQPMYDELKNHPQQFYTGHKKYWFEQEKTQNLQVYSENCFSCEVLYDHYIAQIKTDENYKKCLPTHTRFWFVRQNGKWYMAEWKIL